MRIPPRSRWRVASVVLAALAVLPAPAATFRILQDETDLVVVTAKAGLAAAMAHDHAIAASGYEARIELDPDDPDSARFEMRLPVDGLRVDDPEVQSRIAPRLERLGVRDGAFSGISEKDRAKIRDAMLANGQLDVERYPTISATATVAGPRETGDDPDDPFPLAVALILEIRGRSVERDAAARYEYRDGRLEVEALAGFRFTEFGIRPYSAFLGAVRNRDEFHVYVRIVAVEDVEGSSPEAPPMPGS